MAVFDDSEFFAPRHPSMVSIATFRFTNWVDQATIELRHYIVRSQTERALSQLSNRQLADIGIERSEIVRISAESAARWIG